MFGGINVKCQNRKVAFGHFWNLGEIGSSRKNAFIRYSITRKTSNCFRDWLRLDKVSGKEFDL